MMMGKMINRVTIMAFQSIGFDVEGISVDDVPSPVEGFSAV